MGYQTVPSNIADGVRCDAPNFPDNVHAVVGIDPVDGDDAAFDQAVPLSAIKAGTPSPYKGPGNTALGINDPRFA